MSTYIICKKKKVEIKKKYHALWGREKNISMHDATPTHASILQIKDKTT